MALAIDRLLPLPDHEWPPDPRLGTPQSSTGHSFCLRWLGKHCHDCGGRDRQSEHSEQKPS